ncbi:glycosyltransferase [Antiquaquibacter oligotrophicus]|uniref:glycosyltransferase n=1 Tax=Antiquaquibacter oligotrophicus TaxID=2880260 RepID=UPI002AC8EB23|nr:glycosyltransferase [Antiquaquibacter oligotrophicus]
MDSKGFIKMQGKAMAERNRMGSNVIGIVQPFVPNYRVGLFDAIDEQLAEHGYKLEVWHASPRGRVAARGNSAEGRWSVPVAQHRASFGRRNVTFRNIMGRARRSAAVVAGLASTNLETYLLALDPQVRLMLWGHGKNYTAGNNAIDGSIEAWLCKRSHHLFSYTESGKEHLVLRGNDPEKVTVVVNTTDTTRLVAAKALVSTTESKSIRERFGLGGRFVGLFVGAFDGPKELPFLFEAADKVFSENRDFVLLLAGAGPDSDLVEKMASARPYVRLVGRLDTEDLARISTVVDAVLMPGRIGLVAVDALALGIPVITTNYPYHAPEADYLSAGEDSLWTSFSVDSYAAGIDSLVKDRARLAALAAGALDRGREFSAEASAGRFVNGVLSGLTQ